MKSLTRETGRWRFVISFALFICGTSDRFAASAQEKRQDEVPNFTLKTQDNKEVNFREDLIKNKTAIINFFYTQCKGPCKRNTQNLLQLQKALGDRLGRDVFIYSITLDPEHDTPKVLKTYAETYKTKPGWIFLTGKVDDITTLSRALGLEKPDPDFIRSLKSPSKKNTAADKTIEVMAATNRQPIAANALVGDVIEWKVGPRSSGTHGVRITNWDAVKNYVEVVPVDDQQPFKATTGENETATAAPGKVLLRLSVKSVPPEKIAYESIVPGDPPGEVSVGQRHSGMIAIYNGTTNQKMLTSSLSDSSLILEKMSRLQPPKL